MKPIQGMATHQHYSILILWCAIAYVLVVFSANAAPQPEGNKDDEVVISTGNDIYRYVDENGDIVFQDRPRNEHYVKDPLSSQTAAPAVIKLKKTITPVKDKPKWPVYALLAAALCAFFGAVYLLVQPLLTRWRDEAPMDRCLRIAGMPVFTKIQLDDGQRRNVEVDRIVKTPAGLLVLAEPHFSGHIIGTAEQSTWQTNSDEGQPSVMNPLKLVDTASDITRALIGDIPVFGRVVYTGHAIFDKGRPASVLKFSDFKNGLDHYARPAVEAKQLDAAWRRLMRFPRQNKSPVKPLGVGLRGWLKKRWRETAAGGLAFGSFAFLVVALILFY